MGIYDNIYNFDTLKNEKQFKRPIFFQINKNIFKKRNHKTIMQVMEELNNFQNKRLSRI